MNQLEILHSASVHHQGPAPQTGFVADVCNLARWGEEGQRSSLNIPGLGSLLRRRGVTTGVVCANFFRPVEEAFWNGLGYRCRAAGTNCDDLVIEEAKLLASAGVGRIILGTGDGKYGCDLVRSLGEQGISVHILARKDHCSFEMCRLAAGYAWIDRYVCPRRPSPTIH